MIIKSQYKAYLLRVPTPLLRSLPEFLVPGCAPQPKFRPFSSTSRCHSRVGAMPVSVPPEVNLRVLEPTRPKKNDNLRLEPRKSVQIEGPLGKISLTLPSFVSIDYNEATRKASLNVLDKNVRRQRIMWGTTRAHLANHVAGVSEGHAAVLRMVGVGYRATLESSAASLNPEYKGQKFVNLKIGFSHPIELGLPRGVKATVPQPTRILLEGIVKETVNQFAAKIRLWRKPEPYKGKGIFVNGETIKLKPKRIK